MEHKELEVWKESINMVLTIYEMTRKFPKEELYGLTSQIRRASISIPSNIAEGAARNSDKEFVHFLYVALGSLAEIETQLIISEKLGYINDIKDINSKIVLVRKMLLGLVKYLKKK